MNLANSNVEKGGKMSGRCKKFEERRRMSSAGEDRSDGGGRDTDHLRPQFLIVNQKHYTKNISRTESAMVS
jgi:hypothetical protein